MSTKAPRLATQSEVIGAYYRLRRRREDQKVPGRCVVRCHCFYRSQAPKERQSFRDRLLGCERIPRLLFRESETSPPQRLLPGDVREPQVAQAAKGSATSGMLHP